MSSVIKGSHITYYLIGGMTKTAPVVLLTCLEAIREVLYNPWVQPPVISLMRVLSSQQCFTTRLACVHLCHQTERNKLHLKQLCDRQVTTNFSMCVKQKNRKTMMRDEELTSFFQETKSVHVAVVADLSQVLSGTNVNMRVCWCDRTHFCQRIFNFKSKMPGLQKPYILLMYRVLKHLNIRVKSQKKLGREPPQVLEGGRTYRSDAHLHC